MAWGIDFLSNIYLSRQDYQENPYQVEDRIDELEEEINNINTKINMFAVAKPKDIVPNDWAEDGDIILWINKEVDELIEQLHDSIVHKYQLTLYLEYLNERGDKE